MTYLDISESYVNDGQFLYSVVDDKIYRVQEVKAGRIHFSDPNKSVIILQDNYVELSKTKISHFGYYLVPKYEISKSKIESPELWI